MEQDTGDKRAGEAAEAEGVVLVVEGVALALGERQRQVQAAPLLICERLRHEAREHVVAAGHLTDGLAVRQQPVGHRQGV